MHARSPPQEQLKAQRVAEREAAQREREEAGKRREKERKKREKEKKREAKDREKEKKKREKEREKVRPGQARACAWMGGRRASAGVIHHTCPCHGCIHS